MFPLHTWLPDAHVEAPTGGSVILAGVLLKLGTYGFLRFALPLFPAAARRLRPLLVALAVIGILYGALVAWVQPDMKKLVAYSSVSHLGFVMLGLFAFDLVAWQGALLQMVNHGLSTGALFLLVGMLYDRRHTKQLAEFGGLAKVDAGLRLLPRLLGARLGRPAGAQRLRRRVPDPGRQLPARCGWPTVAGHLRRRPRRDLPPQDARSARSGARSPRRRTAGFADLALREVAALVPLCVLHALDRRRAASRSSSPAEPALDEHCSATVRGRAQRRRRRRRDAAGAATSRRRRAVRRRRGRAVTPRAGSDRRCAARSWCSARGGIAHPAARRLRSRGCAGACTPLALLAAIGAAGLGGLGAGVPDGIVASAGCSRSSADHHRRSRSSCCSRRRSRSSPRTATCGASGILAGEYHALLLWCTAGMLLMLRATSS